MKRIVGESAGALGRAIARWAGALAFLTAAPTFGADPELTLPAGTTFSVRLTSRVGSHTSRVDEPVTAILIAPVQVDDQPVVPSGWTLRGRVAAVGKAAQDDARPMLHLGFFEFSDHEGRGTPIAARVVQVDNARETVDGAGRIVGLRTRRLPPGKVETLLLLAAHAHPAALATVEAGRLAERRLSEAPIAYGPGVEMTLALTAPVSVAPTPLPEPVLPEPGLPELQAFVSALPRRAVAARNRQPSDVTNVLLIGSLAQAAAAFGEAGWTQALPNSVRTDMKSFLALAHRHGYEPAPVSLLELEGRQPDLVFEKQTNTLAKRHHVRLWSQPLTLGGAPIVLGAATHDTGIRFSRAQKTFTHEIHPQIDLERDKIVNDLAFAGRIAARALVERPDTPRAERNAAGDPFETDGRIAVLFLR
jgi:LssY C-terminus